MQRRQPVPQLLHCQSHSRLYRTERLSRSFRDFRLTQSFEVSQLERLALLAWQLAERGSDRLAALFVLDGERWIV